MLSTLETVLREFRDLEYLDPLFDYSRTESLIVRAVAAARDIAVSGDALIEASMDACSALDKNAHYEDQTGRPDVANYLESLSRKLKNAISDYAEIEETNYRLWG